MSLIIVPAESAENPAGTGGNRLFPSGPWQGRIDTVRSKGIPTDKNGKPFAGYASENGEVLSIQLGSNQASDGQDDIGAQKFFADFCVSDGDLDLTSVDLSEYSSPNWQLQIGARRIVNLAIALGAATLTGANGDAAWTVEESFVDDLRSGAYEGREVGFNVMHRKTKSVKTPVVADLSSFHMAD